MATAKALDLSTAHVPEEQLRMPDFGSHRAVEHEFGWIVFVPGGFSEEEAQNTAEVQKNLLEEHDTPDWLLPILVEATREGCILINFDQDAGEDSRFKNFYASEDEMVRQSKLADESFQES